MGDPLRVGASDIERAGILDRTRLQTVAMRVMKLHVLGDSISIQYGPHLRAFLGDAFEYSRKEGDIGPLDRPQGANGGDSDMVLHYLRGGLAEGRRWDVLLLNCGLHDIKTDPATMVCQVPLVRYARNLEEIVGVAGGIAPHLVWVRTTPVVTAVHNARTATFRRFAEDVESYNRVADGVMAARGVPSIDLHGFTLNLGPNLYADHVHFTEPVRVAQAAFIAGWLLGHAFAGGSPAPNG
jgi:lysophospholipase L1-like esterase